MAKKDIKYVWTDKKRTLFGLPLSFTRFFLTDTKFITSIGFLNIEEDELDLYKVTDKKLQLPLGQRIFKCGTIILYVRDTDTPVKIIKSIKEPRKVSAMLDEKINEQRNRFKIQGRDMMGAFNNHICDGDCDAEE
ncbi:MAG: PH domain-containing protein [Clostridiales bacterium]|nr:PH domain-containing protein [Clostridiales bacterium]